MKDSLFFMMASILVGIGVAALVEGIFPTLADHPIVMSVLGGIITAIVYYTISLVKY